MTDTGLAEMDAFERQVADVARRTVGPPRPVDALAIARSAVGDSAVRVRRPHTTATAPGRWRWRSLLTAVLLVALALIALVGGLILTGSIPSPTPSPENDVGPFLPAEIPTEIPHGVIDTSVGPVRWAHLSGDPTTLPGPLEPLPGPSGLLWFGYGGPARLSLECDEETTPIDCYAPLQLWASADAISERVERPLPVDAERATLTPLDGTWWLATWRPTTLWRSDDAETWEQVDLGALVAPGPAELDWELELGLPTRSGDVTVVPVIYRALDGGRLLGKPDLGMWAWPRPLGQDRYEVIEETQGGGVGAGEVAIEAVDGGLRFSGPDGSVIAELGGVGRDFVEAWTANARIVAHHIARVDGTAVVPAPLPGPRLYDRWGHDGPTVFGADDGFHAYRPTADGTIRTWHSPDGKAWTEGRRLGDAEGEPRDVLYLHVRPDWKGSPAAVVAEVIDTEAAPPRVQVWESVDGVSWTSTLDVPDTQYPVRLGEMWLSRSDNDTFAVSRDGTTWDAAPGVQAVITKQMPSGGGAGGPSGVIGDTLFWSVDEWEGDRQRDLWILEFGEVDE